MCFRNNDCEHLRKRQRKKLPWAYVYFVAILVYYARVFNTILRRQKEFQYGQIEDIGCRTFCFF